ncbi:hypothetical protein P0E69_04015 [Chimaeribacter arupi]|uniref:hypothetical protein n=1 Tax=Chimaeribacter arupi TaxID=2060066 RepID=UPI002711E625|nr:hypothetical protein [Chimaeribacter arupi]WKZ93109.1 hypothetical protein P0E69_04015 [Chimaeribacter arupi]
MARKNLFLPQAEVDNVLYCQKVVDVSAARWAVKPPPGRSPFWLQLSLLPFDTTGIPVQGLSFTLQWRPAAEHHPDGLGDHPKMSLVALYYGRRVFAVDTYPYDKHTNRVKVDHPDYADSHVGPHCHLYFEEAADYDIALRPRLCLDPGDFLGYWQFFCATLNVTCQGQIPLPNDDNSGQIPLL